MSQQLLFPDPPKPTDLLFFAILPEPPIPARLTDHAQRLKAKHRLSAEPFVAERFHISLFGLGTYRGIPEALIQLASHAAATIRAPAFGATFNHAMSFAGKPGNLPLVLRTDGPDAEPLTQFHATLGNALRKVGLTAPLDFTPHITLLYDAKSVPQEPIEPLRFSVNQFTLVHSLQGKSRYVKLAQWNLRQ